MGGEEGEEERRGSEMEKAVGTIIRMTGAAGGVEWKREGENDY